MSNIYPNYLTNSLTTLGNIYISDATNCRIRKVTVSTGIITTIAGSSTSFSYSGDGGAATSAGLSSISDVALDSTGNFLSYIN